MFLSPNYTDYSVCFWKRSLDGSINGRIVPSSERMLAEEGTVSDELFIDMFEMRAWDCDSNGRTIFYPKNQRSNIRVSLDGKIYGVIVKPLDGE